MGSKRQVIESLEAQLEHSQRVASAAMRECYKESVRADDAEAKAVEAERLLDGFVSEVVRLDEELAHYQFQVRQLMEERDALLVEIRRSQADERPARMPKAAVVSAVRWPGDGEYAWTHTMGDEAWASDCV